MADPVAGGRHREAALGRRLRDALDERPQRLGDRRRRPGRELAERRHRHGQVDGVEHLAHVVAPRPGGAGLGIDDGALHGGGVQVVVHVPLQAPAVVALGRGVEEGQRIGAEQPFVGGGDQEVGPDAAHVEGHGAGGLGRVEHQRGAGLAAACADGFGIQRRAVGPTAGRQRGDRGFGPNALEHGGGPVAVSRFRHRLDAGAGIPGALAPGVKVGREGLLGHQNALARPDRQVDRRGPDAIAGGGHDGDVAGLGPDQTGEQGPQLLRLARRDHGVVIPGIHLAPDAGLARGPRRPEQRRPGGAVEEGDPLGNVEKAALVVDHRSTVRRLLSQGPLISFEPFA